MRGRLKAAGKTIKGEDAGGKHRGSSIDRKASAVDSEITQLVVAPRDLYLVDALLHVTPAMERYELAMELLPLFEFYGGLGKLFKHALNHELSKLASSTCDESTLFRAESLAGCLISVYLSKHGKKYLRWLLKSTVNKIVKDNISFEVDPSRLKNEAKRKKNIKTLVSFVSSLMTQMCSHISKCPTPVRFAMHVVRQCVTEQFSNMAVKAVAGFFVLRFICPALVTPESFGLCKSDTPIASNARRSLILLGKVIQNLANDVDFGEKENYLSDLNESMMEHSGSLKDFLSELSSDSEMISESDVPSDELGDASVHVSLRVFQNQVEVFGFLAQRNKTNEMCRLRRILRRGFTPFGLGAVHEELLMTHRGQADRHGASSKMHGIDDEPGGDVMATLGGMSGACAKDFLCALVRHEKAISSDVIVESSAGSKSLIAELKGTSKMKEKVPLHKLYLDMYHSLPTEDRLKALIRIIAIGQEYQNEMVRTHQEDMMKAKISLESLTSNWELRDRKQRKQISRLNAELSFAKAFHASEEVFGGDRPLLPQLWSPLHPAPFLNSTPSLEDVAVVNGTGEAPVKKKRGSNRQRSKGASHARQKSREKCASPPPHALVKGASSDRLMEDKLGLPARPSSKSLSHEDSEEDMQRQRVKMRAFRSSKISLSFGSMKRNVKKGASPSADDSALLEITRESNTMPLGRSRAGSVALESPAHLSRPRRKDGDVARVSGPIALTKWSRVEGTTAFGLSSSGPSSTHGRSSKSSPLASSAGRSTLLDDLKKAEANRSAKRTVSAEKAAQTGTSASEDAIERKKSDLPPGTMARAIYAWQAEEEGDLSFPKGALVKVTRGKSNKNWWRGEYDGAKGRFPKTYVEVCDDESSVSGNVLE